MTLMDFRWLFHTSALGQSPVCGPYCEFEWAFLTAQPGLAQFGPTWTGSECGQLLGAVRKQRKCGSRSFYYSLFFALTFWFYMCVCHPVCAYVCVFVLWPVFHSATAWLALRIVLPWQEGCATLSAFWIKLNRTQAESRAQATADPIEGLHHNIKLRISVSFMKIQALNVYHQWHTGCSWHLQ